MIVTLPGAIAVTSPLLASTVATLSSEDFQVAVGYVAFAGAIVAFNLSVLPTFMLTFVLLSVISLAGMKSFLTVTLQVANVPLPSAAVHVIVASPSTPQAAISPVATFVIATMFRKNDYFD